MCIRDSTYTLDFTPTEDYGELRLQIEFGTSLVNFWIDDITLTSTTCQEQVIEYVWECRESDGAGGWLAWTTIAGETGETYDPPAQTTTKQYRRLASVEGCNDFESSNIVEVEICPCEVTAEADESICPGESAQLSAEGTGIGTINYSWTPAADLDDPTSANPIATPSETTTYTVTAIDANGCDVTGEVTITVYPEMIVEAGAGVELCAGGDVQLNATVMTSDSPMSTNFIYSWGPTSGLSNPNIANPLASPATTTTYTVTVTDEHGCTATDDVAVNVFEMPGDFNITNTNATCGDDFGTITVTWTASLGITDLEFSIDGGVTYGSAILATDETITFTDLLPGTYDLYVRRGDDQCPVDIVDATILEITEPLLAAGLDQQICPTETADFTAEVTAGTAPYTYNWTGPNGFTSNGANISVNEAGEYYIHLIDAEGCEVRDTVLVTVLTLEQGQISEPDIACPSNDPEPILSLESLSHCNLLDNHEFINAIGSEWVLNAQDGGAATTIIDDTEQLSGTNSLYVDVTSTTSGINQVRLQQVIQPVFSDEAYDISFEARAQVARDIRIRVINMDNFSTLGQQVFSLSTIADTYTFTMSPDSDVDRVRFHIEFGNSTENFWIDNIVMQPQSCEEPTIVYSWECRESDGAGGFSPWTTIPAANGESYDPPVQLVTKQYRRVATILGCSEVYTSNEIQIDSCPCEVVVDDATICEGEETTLSSSVTGFGTITYSWSPATTLSDASIASPIATPDATTVYTLTATDESGCVATADATVTVQDTTVIFCQRYRVRYDDANWQQWINFTGDCVLELCEGTGITDFQFDGGPDVNTGWVWRDEDGNASTEIDEIVLFPNIGLNDAGIYTGELTNANGCVSRLSFEVIVNQNNTADVSPDVVQCEGDGPVTLTASGGMTYLWDDPAGSTTATITVNPSVTTTYTVTVTDGTCFDTDQVTVTISPNPVVDAGPDITLCRGESGQLGTQSKVQYTPGNLQLINSTHQTQWGSLASLFNNIDDTGDRSFHTVKNNNGQDWGVGYSLGGTFDISAVSIDRRNDVCCTARGNGGIIQILNAGVVVYESSIITGPGDGEVFAAPSISGISGDEVRYIFKNGINTEGGNTLNFSEFNIYLEDPTITGSFTYEWSPTDGLSNPNIQNPIVSPTMTTTYVVTATDENGCTATDDITVNVNDTPEITDITSTDATCGLDNGSITIAFNDVVGITNLEFSLDNGVTWQPLVNDADGTVNYNDLSAGVYELIVRDPIINCGENLGEVVITDVPVLTVDLGPEQEICAGETEVLTPIVLDGIEPMTYLWTGPGGFSSTESSVTVSIEGPYTLEVTDANGCIAEDLTILNVLDIEPGQIGTPGILCPENDPEIITNEELPSACNFISNHQADNGITDWVIWSHPTSISNPATMQQDNSGVLSGDNSCLLYTSPSPRDATLSRMPSSA